MLCKVPNFLEKSTFEHKTNKPALAVNQLTSFPAMNLGTRKLPGSPRIIVSAIFDVNCGLQGIATVFLSKMNLRRR